MVLIKSKAAGRLRYLRWRWLQNFRDSLAYTFDKRNLDTSSALILEKLRYDGITESSEYPDRTHFLDVQREALRAVDRVSVTHRQTLQAVPNDRKLSRDSLGREESKDFLQILTPKVFTYESVYLRYAVQPEFIAIANSYLGLHARLRAIHLWLNRPTENEPASTQLWHRDGDDLSNLKIFTYLTDVGQDNGPFAFVPGSQVLGRRQITPECSELGRSTDTQMRQVVPDSDWRVCTGRAGSVIFADTSGYHKGVKPVEDKRVMLMVHYTSRKAVTGSELKLEGNVPTALVRSQRIALGLYD